MRSRVEGREHPTSDNHSHTHDVDAVAGCFISNDSIDGDIPALLVAAPLSLRESTQWLRLPGTFVRKERALFCRTRSRAALLLRAHGQIR